MITLLNKIAKWFRYWFWTRPTAKPPKEIPAQPKATEVAREWMVITYHGQNIPMHVNEYPLWKALSRTDKRAMKDKTAKQEAKGLIRFEEINGKMICVKNKDYQAIADKKKAEK